MDGKNRVIHLQPSPPDHHHDEDPGQGVEPCRHLEDRVDVNFALIKQHGHEHAALSGHVERQGEHHAQHHHVDVHKRDGPVAPHVQDYRQHVVDDELAPHVEVEPELKDIRGNHNRGWNLESPGEAVELVCIVLILLRVEEETPVADVRHDAQARRSCDNLQHVSGDFRLLVGWRVLVHAGRDESEHPLAENENTTQDSAHDPLWALDVPWFGAEAWLCADLLQHASALGCLGANVYLLDHHDARGKDAEDEDDTAHDHHRPHRGHASTDPVSFSQALLQFCLGVEILQNLLGRLELPRSSPLMACLKLYHPLVVRAVAAACGRPTACYGDSWSTRGGTRLGRGRGGRSLVEHGDFQHKPVNACGLAQQ
mmetsp:Transcript_108355/g.305537  ORF Transcript_108355/g.305537 Transcript_108355/m.305537 type:complete len:369 (-) Transcript_108355:40-1146(-)